MQKYRKKIGRQVIEVFHEQKTPGQSARLQIVQFVDDARALINGGNFIASTF
jgi:hypothetical protein